MKKLITILMAVCLCLSLAACGGNTDPGNTEPGTTAPATKTVYLPETQVYEYEDEATDDMTIKYEYDENGNVTKATQISGDIEVVMTYTYGENGKVAVMTQDMGDMEITVSCTYDENGNMTSQTMKNGDTVTQSTAYTYDDQNRQVSVTTTVGEMESVTTYTYGEGDRPLTATMTQNGVLSQKMTLTYNEEGKRTAIVATNADGDVATETKIIYEGNMETQTIADAQGNVMQTLVRTYDENGNVIKDVFTSPYSNYTCTYTYITMEVPA